MFFWFLIENKYLLSIFSIDIFWLLHYLLFSGGFHLTRMWDLWTTLRLVMSHVKRSISSMTDALAKTALVNHIMTGGEEFLLPLLRICKRMIYYEWWVFCQKKKKKNLLLNFWNFWSNRKCKIFDFLVFSEYYWKKISSIKKKLVF